MNNKVAVGIGRNFWIISTVGLVWNILGGVNFISQLNADFVASLPGTHRAIIEGRPVWATAGFAMTVFGGAIGCLLLLFRKSAAFHVFVASLFGCVVTMVHTTAVTSTIEFSLFEIFLMILMPLIVAGFFTWYAKQAGNKGWLR
jgi:hypothetical protein